MKHKIAIASAVALIAVIALIWPAKINSQQAKGLVEQYFAELKTQNWPAIETMFDTPFVLESVDNIANESVSVELQAPQFIEYLQELQKNQQNYQFFYTVQDVVKEEDAIIVDVLSNESWVMNDQTIKAKVNRKFHLANGWGGVVVHQLDIETSYQ